MADLLRLAGLGLTALLSAAAEAAPLGDFGRAATDDRGLVAPFSRDWQAPNGRQIKGMNQTDQEREMHDRIWRFLIAPHARQWSDGPTEPKLVALAGGRGIDHSRYYRWLTGVPFQSSRVRFNTIADDIGADLLTLPDTFAAICAVLEIDRRRALAANDIAGIEPRLLHQRELRQAENTAHIRRFADTLRYRYASYSLALDHLLVETPHEEAVRVDQRLSELAIWVDLADAGDFCRDTWGDWADDGALPGRVLIEAPSEGEYRK